MQFGAINHMEPCNWKFLSQGFNWDDDRKDKDFQFTIILLIFSLIYFICVGKNKAETMLHGLKSDIFME